MSDLSASNLLYGGGGPAIITPLRPPEPFVNPFLSYLGAAMLLAAPAEPGAAGKLARYQRVADGLAWKAPADQPRRPLTDQLPDYTVDIKSIGSDIGRYTSIRISQGGKGLYAWEEHGHGVGLVRDGVLYRAEYDQMSSGCAIIAIDLKAGQELWKASLKGLGPISHSKYHNRVRMERVDDAVFAVYGQESAGRYAELVEFKTGRTVGHKVFPRD
jgi:hypothetical protein